MNPGAIWNCVKTAWSSALHAILTFVTNIGQSATVVQESHATNTLHLTVLIADRCLHPNQAFAISNKPSVEI